MRNAKNVRNVVIFGMDSSSSSDGDNRKINLLVLGEGPTQGINDSSDAGERKLSIKNLVKQIQNFA